MEDPMLTDTLQPAVSPADTLLQISGGGVLPRCLHAIANLGVADALGEFPESALALAAATGANADALARALRLLAAHGVFTHTNGLFRHNEASRLLRADHPQSLRPMVRMFGLPAFWPVQGEMEAAIRTGAPVADQVLAGGVWGYFATNPRESRIFDEAMTAKAHGQVAAVVAAYDFSPFRVIGDIGGGRGHLLQAVLAAAPHATGVLFDQPHVLQQAAAAASDRLTLHGGSFFTDDLPACDAYLLMEVIHDWDDERSLQILGRVRAAARPGARVLIIEAIVPDEPGPSFAKTLDLWMLTIGGRQRTQEEYANLFADSGLRFTREIPTPAGVSILEGVRA
jgi:hypothetical protein